MHVRMYVCLFTESISPLTTTATATATTTTNTATT